MVAFYVPHLMNPKCTIFVLVKCISNVAHSKHLISFFFFWQGWDSFDLNQVLVWMLTMRSLPHAWMLHFKRQIIHHPYWNEKTYWHTSSINLKTFSRSSWTMVLRISFPPFLQYITTCSLELEPWLLMCMQSWFLYWQCIKW